MVKAGERNTRERVLEVAEASFAEHGYHGTRLHLIAEGVGIQKASLFHYFESKEHLYRAVLEEGFGETESTVRHVLEGKCGWIEKVGVLVEEYIDMVAAHPARTKILLRQSLGDAPASFEPATVAERLLNEVVKFVREGQRAKVFAPIDPVSLVLGVVGMVAFFFTSAPVVAPGYFGDPCDARCVERVKKHVVSMVWRCLAGGDRPRTATREAATA